MAARAATAPEHPYQYALDLTELGMLDVWTGQVSDASFLLPDSKDRLQNIESEDAEAFLAHNIEHAVVYSA